MGSSDLILRRRRDNIDRFIPNPAALDLNYAHFLLTGGRPWKESCPGSSLSSDAYQRTLSQVFNMNRPRIFSFKDKSPVPNNPTQVSAKYQKRIISKNCEYTLDAIDMIDDFSCNLLDWGPANLLAIALDTTVYLYCPADRLSRELCTVAEEDGPVTSVSWDSDGRRIAIGLNNSKVQLWDSITTKQIRTLNGRHRTRVGSMAWNRDILSTGDKDGIIVNSDTRVKSHTVDTYRGHKLEVCGLRWSPSGKYLSSGGLDNQVLLWDRSASGSGSRRWVHSFRDHKAAVRALAWCPFQSSLLATGGGELDRCIKFWNTSTGACLSSVDTGSQVCGLVWSKRDRELLSSQGCNQKNQLVVWQYPSMLKLAELAGHEKRPLYLAQSPDGVTVASAAGDQFLKFWNVFRAQEVEATPEPFAHFNRIR